MRKLGVFAVLLAACSSGGASVACEEFISQNREAPAEINLASQEVEDRGKTASGATVWRVTGSASVGEGSVEFVCQVRQDDSQWVLEQLTYG